MPEVERVADRVAVLSRRLIAIGTPGSLRQKLFAPRVRIVLTQAAEPYAVALRTAGASDIRVDGVVMSVGVADTPLTIPEVVRRLVETGAGVESVMPEEPPLEDVYLKLLHPDDEVS